MINKIAKIAADNIRVERTGKITIADDGDGVYHLFKLPKKALVLGFHVEILDAPADGGDDPTLKLGYLGNAEVSGDDDYFSADAAPLVEGMKSYTKPKWFVDAGGALTATYDSGDASGDLEIRAFAVYTVIH